MAAPSQLTTLSHLLGSAEASVTVASTAARTLLGSNILIPANTMQVGSVLKADLYANYGVTGTPTIIFDVAFGTSSTAVGTAVITSATFTTAGAGNVVVRYRGTVLVAGASGTIMGALEVISKDTGIASYVLVDTTADSVDWSVDQYITVGVTWGASSSSNTITASQFYVEVQGI